MKTPHGFTLVEVSIAMIIIGLLIGGTIGGAQLIWTAQVQKETQELKNIESAILTFKNIYRRLPGDIPNPSAVLSDCTDTPCATGGNGNRSLDSASWGEALTPHNGKIYTLEPPKCREFSKLTHAKFNINDIWGRTTQSLVRWRVSNDHLRR